MAANIAPLLILLGLAIAIAAEAYIHRCRHPRSTTRKERTPR